MSHQRTLKGLPPEIVKALEEGRALDAELRRIVMEREKLDEKEMALLEQKAQLKQRAERGNARPVDPGSAGQDTGDSPMSKKQDKSGPGRRQAAPVPFQLSLFYFEVKEQYSNVVQLYNEIPKYVCDAPRDQKHLESIEREFKVDGTSYRVVLHPARIKINDEAGKMKGTKELFIGTREELVEDAITKIAIAKRRLYTLADTTRVKITIHEIQIELKRTNHQYSYEEIKEAIQILGGARMVIEEIGGEGIWSVSTYPEYMLSSDSSEPFGFVQFHPLLSEGIKRGLYSQFDYDLAMELPGRYARRLYKLLAAKFKWAHPTREPYVVNLAAFLSRHGFKQYDRITDNAKLFRQALEALKASKVVIAWKEKSKKKGRKTVDFEYSLRPTPEFASATRRSQGIAKEIKEKLEK